jgi:hypothetical protein
MDHPQITQISRIQNAVSKALFFVLHRHRNLSFASKVMDHVRFGFAVSHPAAKPNPL